MIDAGEATDNFGRIVGGCGEQSAKFKALFTWAKGEEGHRMGPGHKSRPWPHDWAKNALVRPPKSVLSIVVTTRRPLCSIYIDDAAKLLRSARSTCI